MNGADNTVVVQYKQTITLWKVSGDSKTEEQRGNHSDCCSDLNKGKIRFVVL